MPLTSTNNPYLLVLDIQEEAIFSLSLGLGDCGDGFGGGEKGWTTTRTDAV
jgi:hypothetical protein